MSSVLEPLAPSREDPVVRGASELVGGPHGRHAPPARGRVALLLLLVLTAATCWLGWVQKAPCRTHNWDGFQYTHICYTDVFALYYAEGLVDGKVPYAQTPVEYPVVIGGLMYVGAQVAELASPPDRGRTFFDVTALLLTGAALFVTWTTAALSGRRRWDAAMVALSPVLLFHAFTNWDLAAVALSSAGLLLWARRRPLPAGILIGLAVATKLYPALFFVPLLALCLRERRLRAWLVSLAGAVGGWLVVDLPVWLAYPDSFGRFWSLNRSRGADWDSLWLGLEHIRRRPLDIVAPGGSPTLLNAAVAAGVLLGLSGVVALALLASRRPRLPQLLFLGLAGFLLVNKVDSPQYVLWLLPLAVLARPRWGAILAWQATEVALLFFRFYLFVGNDKPGSGLDYAWFVGSVLVRDLALAMLMALVVRDVVHSEGDVVRRRGVDDPAGGVLVTA